MLHTMWSFRAVGVAVRRMPPFSRVAKTELPLYEPRLLSPVFNECGSHCLMQYRCVVYNKITKNKLLMNKKRDSHFEDKMDEEKPLRIMKRLVAYLMKHPGQKALYRFVIRRAKQFGIIKPLRASDVIRKYPHFVIIERPPDEMEYWVTVAKPVIELMEVEKQVKKQMVDSAVVRLRKVLMMSYTRRIELGKISQLQDELGLPEDFKKSVIKANPHLFKLVKSPRDVGKKDFMPRIRLMEWDPQFAVPAIEKFRREKSLSHAYSFPINFPPGFRIKTSIRYKLRTFQRLAYRSPYEDTTDLDLNSAEAYKRAVAVIHEFLHICVGKRTQVDRLALLREEFKLPQKVGKSVLQHPGIFYMSIKCNVHTIFLREAFTKGEVAEKDPLLHVKEKYLELIRACRVTYKMRKKEVENMNFITVDDKKHGKRRSIHDYWEVTSRDESRGNRDRSDHGQREEYESANEMEGTVGHNSSEDDSGEDKEEVEDVSGDNECTEEDEDGYNSNEDDDEDKDEAEEVSEDDECTDVDFVDGGEEEESQEEGERQEDKDEDEDDDECKAADVQVSAQAKG